MQIHSPKYSFVKFGSPEASNNCCDGEQEFCIPVIEETDTYFQFKIVGASFAETESIWATPLSEFQLALVRGIGNTAITVPANTLRNWTVDDSLLFEKYRTAATEVTYLWRNPFKDILTLIDCDGCFQLALIANITDPATVLLSNCFTRACRDCYTSVLKYTNEEDAFDFNYCNIANPVNRVRLPFFFQQPQFSDDETIYVKSDGSIKMLKSVTKKEYQVSTEHFPEYIHEKLKVALSHDFTAISSGTYNGNFRKSGSYEIEWTDNICIAPAKFKALVSPYAVRNSNCADCDPLDFGCSIPENIQCSIVNNGDTTQTITFTWANLLTGVSSMAIGYRLHSVGGSFTSATGGFTSPRTITLPLGVYDFQFTTQGGSCANQSTPIYSSIGTAGGCDSVSIDGSTDLPNATVGTPYSYNIGLDGDTPFALANIIKPSWMTISISGFVVTFGGTPVGPGTSIPVSFDITNCEGTFSVTVNDAINVAAAVPGNITLDCGGSPSQDPIAFGVAGTFTFYNVPIAVITPGTVTLTAHNDQSGTLSGYSMYKQYTAVVTAGQTSIDFEIDYDGGGINTVFEMTFQATDTSGTDTCTDNLFSFI